MDWIEIQTGLNYWIKDGLETVRFSGGEPTLHPNILDAVKMCHDKGVPRIGMTSNGSNHLTLYKNLVDAGLTNISISLDASSAELGDRMTGGIKGAWSKVVNNIREISKITEVIVNVVYNEANIENTINTILFAHDLGVKDILLVAASQYDHAAAGLQSLPQGIFDAHPILKYRVENAFSRPTVRGLALTDAHHCALVLDDSIIAGEYHFPCSLYMREGGNPIGKVTTTMRQERYQWFLSHNTYADPICKKFCVDLYIDYNNTYARFHNEHFI
jgi:organic radical activating enzyme